jgi:hypothetical protein
MKSKLPYILLYILGVVIGIALTLVDARAQQPATNGQTKEGTYTVTSSIEIGVRGVSVDGNGNKYRSDLNYEPGFQVFNSNLLVRSKENNGPMFDTLMINSFGWGGEPSRYLRVNAEKTKWYRFDGNYRRIDYFNSLTNIALNQHISNTEHRLGDFDLTLLPQNKRIKFNVGYSLERNSGPAVTTYDYARDEFPVLAATRVRGDDYRVGVDASVGPFDLSFQQGWRYFREDTTYTVDEPQIGNNPINTSVINTFNRDLPTRGRIPYSRASLHTLLAKKVDITGRIIYQSATTNYNLFETITGKDASNNNIKLDEFQISGNAKRPSTIADIGVTVFATDRLRISDTISLNTFQINGGQELLESLMRTRTTAAGETVLPPLFVDTLSFRTTKYRRAAHTIELDYEFHPRFSAHIGHRYTDRHIELFALDRNALAAPPEPAEPELFDNRTNTIFFGLKAKPARIWTLYFDMERGDSDNVFTRVDNYDFTNFRIRSILRPTKQLAINTSVITKDNTNPTLVDRISRENFGSDINSRIYSASVDWTASEKLSFNSGFTKTHITSDAAIVFFFNGVRQQGRSRYFVNDTFGFINMYAQLHKRASLYASYSIHKDFGQGDRVSGLQGAVLTRPELITSYPVQFQTPEFRLAVRLNDRLDWNVGYQYFDFKEKFVNQQFYQAHLPYTSLKIYFNRPKG